VLPEGSGAGRTRKTWLLSRALYRCKHVPLGHVGAGERRAVLRNLLLAWAPFDRTDYRVALRGDHALAFAWDSDAVRGLLAAAGAPDSATVWPESLLREPLTADGLRVLQCLEGVEAQAWRQQALVATRWWPQPPGQNEAQAWLRSLGPLAGDIEALPTAAPVAWRRRPWLDVQSADELQSTSSRWERIAVGSALVGFAALSAAQAHQALAAYDERQSLQRELDRVRLEAAPVLAARDRAETMAREVQSLALQLTGVSPLELLKHLADVLPARGVTLKELELSGQKLRLSLELAADLQRSALVKDLQSGAWLTKVTEARDTSNRGWIVFEADLARHRAPAGTERAVAPVAAPPVPLPVQAAAPQASAQRP
jgi:hypothetical protein